MDPAPFASRIIRCTVSAVCRLMVLTTLATVAKFVNMARKRGGNVLRFSSTREARQADWRERVIARLPIVGTANAGERTPAAPRKAPKDSYGLAAAFRQAGLPELLPEFVFHPSRKWAFDYASLAHMIAIEIEGGIWRPGGGAHSHPTAIVRDLQKYNAATLIGWRVLRYQPQDIGEAISDFRMLLLEDT
jgi:hypothetical protein